MLKIPKKTEGVFYTKLPLAGTAYLLDQLTKTERHLFFVITETPQAAVVLQKAYHFFAPSQECLVFPAWETLPYDQFSPHPSIISERLLSLQRLRNLQSGLIIAPLGTVLQRLPPAEFLAGQVFSFKKGQSFQWEVMRQQLQKAGYHAVNQVALPGEFAVRGSLFDIFPTGSKAPFRVDLFDDEIESIKRFDPETQRSFETVSAVEILPAHEFPLNPEGIRFFREQFREAFSVNPSQCPVYQAVSEGEAPPGIEYYLPLFFEKLSTIFDYLPEDSVICADESIKALAKLDWEQIEERYAQLSHDILRPILPPEKIFLPPEIFNQSIKPFGKIYGSEKPESLSTGMKHLPNLLMEAKSVHPFSTLQSFCANYPKVLFSAETLGRRENLLALLKPHFENIQLLETWEDFLNASQGVFLTVSPIEEGFSNENFALIPEAALLGAQVVQSRRRKSKNFESDLVLRNLAELKLNDPIVHIDHGIGRYQGLEILTVGGQAGEFLKIAYEGGNLFVPVCNLHLISRYAGLDPDHAPVHRLGSDQWDKAKRKAAEQVRDVAAELLKIYALREAQEGFRYEKPDEHYQLFSTNFPFEETPDQQLAIDAVIQDMTSPRPMDRLICGDVGFGKTEVAMRAAFLAAQSGKQVGILVPTTLLAQQHAETFADRFANTPIKIGVISRFKTGKEQKEVLEKLENGQLDILIGTHKLLQSEIKFRDLGLLIIDEEHRFGVRQKEALKKWRANVDVLAMTATPIPRTLSMAMSEVRDLSIIATPPEKRLSIKTFVREFDSALIREAVLRETLRGGQVYYLHNDVMTIEKAADDLRKLLPQARVAVAHGQLHERELERVMADFYHQKFNVLVCSTIIETGIDVPNANTIIIQRADKFGLAQLHQLRGRVGRSHHQAYAYLLTPPPKSLTSDAERRLEAISSLEDLGAGFVLATHDLEIRGAGELLGENQSGHIQAIGYGLYTELLDRAVKNLKKGGSLDEAWEEEKTSEIELQLPAFIPDDYISDVNVRLVFYKRIASAEDEVALKDLRSELIDRFGLLPIQAQYLFDQMHLKWQAAALGIQQIKAHNKGGVIEFLPTTPIHPAKIIELIQKKPKAFKLDGPTRLKFSWENEVPHEKRIETILALLDKLS